MKYQSLHDAKLIAVSFDWVKGVSFLQFEGDHRRWSLRAEGVKKMQFLRTFPWGRSSFVNDVFGPTDLPDGLQSLQIQVQSGDTIEVNAQLFDLLSEPAAGSV
ncbi:MAG TPA: hypothetical protein VFR68_11350 [Candidatus Dormibacteraeota bacterium]|nr:hypothetical protein [Candidatus Dormibacteraeota bacterium]